MAGQGGNGGNPVVKRMSLSQASLPQLNQLISQVEEEIKLLTESLGQLKMVQQKFADSHDRLDIFNDKGQERQILLPVTSSMYVPGEIKDVKSVMVDIGTGYYAEKSIPDAKAYFKRKVDFVGKQLEKIHQGLVEKQALRQAAVEAMNVKVQQQMSQSQLTDKVATMKT